MIMYKKLVVIFYISFFLILISLSSIGSWGSLSAPAQDMPGTECLWEIDDGRLFSPDGFDMCPMEDASQTEVFVEYSILDQKPADIFSFPGGLAGVLAFEERCLPSKIFLYYTLSHSYSNAILSLAIFGCGNFTVQFDESPPQQMTINTGYSWQTIEISSPYICSGKHIITLEAKDDKAYAEFDYLKLSGLRDTDQDGIADPEEGLLDSDDDGLEDWQDADCAMIPHPHPFPDWDRETYLLITRSGRLQEPNFFPVFQEVSLTDIYSNPDPNHPSTPDWTGFEPIYGLISVQIGNLEIGREVTVIVSPPSPLKGIEELWAKNVQEGDWNKLDVVMNIKSNQLQFTVKDNGITDIDGQADGRICLYFSLGIPNRLSSDSLNSCFLGILRRWASRHE